MKKIIFLVLFLMAACNLQAQQTIDLEKLKPKHIIDTWEIIVGANRSILNDHGFSSYVKNLSQNILTANYYSKNGYQLGLGLSHAFSRKIDIVGRVSWERRDYSYFVEDKNNPNNYLFYKDYYADYFLAFSLLPRYFFKKNFYVGIGGAYGKQQKSFDQSYIYINGQIMNQTTYVNTKRLRNAFDLVASFGYKIKASNKYSFSLNFSYNYALTNIYNANHLKLSSNSINLSFILIRHRKNSMFSTK